MLQAKLTILGCGSALPTYQQSPSGQILSLCDRDFLIDCGEGVQLTMRQMGLHTNRLYSIFISHLHGDHCFGLIGLISTLSMLHRTQPMHIYAHRDLEKLLRPMLDYHCEELSFEVVFHPINPRKQEVIYEDRMVEVQTIPLKHKVPCCGFLFTEVRRRPVENPADGEDVFERVRTKRYAYCTDTMYNEKIVPQIEGVDLLFHDSTFTEEWADRCRSTKHSTARQAASIAKLAHAGQLLVGHFSSRTDDHEQFLNEAQEVFPNAILAREREVITF